MSCLGRRRAAISVGVASACVVEDTGEYDGIGSRAFGPQDPSARMNLCGHWEFNHATRCDGEYDRFGVFRTVEREGRREVDWYSIKFPSATFGERASNKFNSIAPEVVANCDALILRIRGQFLVNRIASRAFDGRTRCPR